MSGQPTGTAWQRLAEAVEHLFPGYFALVMATGIVSIAAHLLDDAAHRVGASRGQYRRVRRVDHHARALACWRTFRAWSKT